MQVSCCSEIIFKSYALTQPPARAKELGCEDPPSYPGGGFMGTGHIKEMTTADKNQQFPDLMQYREKLMSEIHGRECSTFKLYLLGQEIFFTSDPKNIQAMLANKFNDWYLGPARRNNMIATLGDGIVRHSRRSKQPEADRYLVRSRRKEVGA